MAYIPKTYKASEMTEVLALLTSNAYHSFSDIEAGAIVKMLHNAGFRIVRTGKAGVSKKKKAQH